MGKTFVISTAVERLQIDNESLTENLCFLAGNLCNDYIEDLFADHFYTSFHKRSKIGPFQ
jgi:hypothetical protein